ncbi:unnamed protein product [Gongylonema pulchrum]|uniref:WGS project CAFE00000000 data, contig n=1 Tax=Gongylonema pulchrum TaxID=637853 RepID=A0A183DRI9_9BILA|nr:unnamed protein product [Gongylonema pulchrum]
MVRIGFIERYGWRLKHTIYDGCLRTTLERASAFYGGWTTQSYHSMFGTIVVWASIGRRVAQTTRKYGPSALDALRNCGATGKKALSQAPRMSPMNMGLRCLMPYAIVRLPERKCQARHREGVKYGPSVPDALRDYGSTGKESRSCGRRAGVGDQWRAILASCNKKMS